MSYSTLTIVALVLASTTMLLAIVVAKLLRDEKRRSDARVAVLSAMAAEAAALDPLPESDPQEPPARDYADSLTLEARPLALAHSAAPAAGADIFAAHEEPSAWPKRLAVAGSLAAVVLVVVTIARSGVFGGAASGSPASPAATAAEAPLAQLPLDLLSLTQSQEGGTLTITGLVENPRAGAPLSKLVATAFLFGADGSFLASGRAPLDFTMLRPGDESGFVIAVPVNAPVARYRIGFRGEDGHVIGHVDRRSSGTIARGPS